jgi:hypothetical protein
MFLRVLHIILIHGITEISSQAATQIFVAFLLENI